MEKFEKMVKQNQAESKEKIASAIVAIIEMEQGRFASLQSAQDFPEVSFTKYHRP